MAEVIVIGGGLAGSEAAWQIARLGGKVRLYEMRPTRSTAAHQTDRLAEIVCSNSLKSDQPYNASWLLKEELRRWVAKEIGALAKPDDIRFTDMLPKTRSGKIMRRLLRELATSGEVKGD